jgi:hypothetical protein
MEPVMFEPVAPEYETQVSPPRTYNEIVLLNNFFMILNKNYFANERE